MKEGQPNRLPSGKIADGSGAPPTLKGFGPGQAKLVVITDNAEKMRLVAFWRDRLPRGWRQRRGTLSPRHADHIPVGFGAGFTVVRSEQSVVAVAGHAFVINRVLSGGTKPIPTGGSLVRSLLGESMRPPKGHCHIPLGQAS